MVEPSTSLPGSRLSLQELVVSYGTGNIVVDHVSLDVAGGEFVTLLGPSGSGKTTTLNAIAGFVSPDQGQILLDDTSINRLPPHKRNIGMVFQHYALFPHLTVEQNLAFPLRRRRLPATDRKEQVDRALRLVQLEGFGSRLPRQLSGGQQQRVALARALVFQPRLLLMDEPLGALDKKLREALQAEIKRVHEEVGVTVMYVTHDQEEAMVLSDRVAILNQGRVEQVGTPTDLYEHPQTLFVADFIGESNRFRGTATVEGTTTVIRHGTLRLRAASSPLVRSGSVAALVLRPERVTLQPVTGAIPGDANILVGRIERVSYLGFSRLVTLRLPTGDVLQAREQAGAFSNLAEGEQAAITWDLNEAILLPVDDAPEAEPPPIDSEATLNDAGQGSHDRSNAPRSGKQRLPPRTRREEDPT